MKLTKKEEEKIIIEKIPMVNKIAKNLSSKYNVSAEELESYGYEALINYTRNYDGHSNMNSYIYRNVWRFMHNSIPIIAGFSKSKKLFWMYNKAFSKLLKDDIEISDNKENIDIDIDTARKIVAEIEKENNLILSDERKSEVVNYILLKNNAYLDELYDNCDLAYLEKLSETIENEMYTSKLNKALRYDCKFLTAKERKLIIEKMGLNSTMKTYSNIEKEKSTYICKSANLEAKVLRKLRHPSIAKNLFDYKDYDSRINGSNTSTGVGRVIS